MAKYKLEMCYPVVRCATLCAAHLAKHSKLEVNVRETELSKHKVLWRRHYSCFLASSTVSCSIAQAIISYLFQAQLTIYHSMQVVVVEAFGNTPEVLEQVVESLLVVEPFHKLKFKRKFSQPYIIYSAVLRAERAHQPSLVLFDSSTGT